MDKKQKIWLAVFSAMFLIPEILWFLGVRGSINIPWLPIETFDQLKNIFIVYFTTLVPFIGLIGVAKIVANLKLNKKIKILIYFMLAPFLIWTGCASLILIWVMIYYINQSPQIG